MWPNFWISKRKPCIGGLWIGTNKNENRTNLSSLWNDMSTGKDVLIEFLLELLKEERDQRRKETEGNAGLIRDLMSKFEKLETDIIFERHTRHLHHRVGRIVCDGGEDEVDGWNAHLTVLKIVMSHWNSPGSKNRSLKATHVRRRCCSALIGQSSDYKTGVQGQRCHSVKMSGEDSSMWTLGKRSGEKALNVVVKKYEGHVLIHFSALL